MKFRFALAIAATSLGTAQAQQYPVKPIRIIAPFTAGGPVDIEARRHATRLTDILGQPVLLDYKPGAGETIGTHYVAKAAPDGYTLLVISGSLVTNATLVTRVPYDLRTVFAPITQLTSQPYVLLAHPSVPAKTVRELIAYAKANSDKLNYASSGTGTVVVIRDQLMESQPELFKRHMAGNLHRIANKTAAVIERSVDNMVEEGVKPNQVPGLSVALGILLDKQAQLMGETPVSVVEHRHLLDPEAIKSALLRVAGAESPEPINVTATASGSSESVIVQ